MLGIMEDLPAPHQDDGDLPSKSKVSKAKKVPNNGSTITDFFKSPPKPAVPKPVNLLGYFQQKSSPNNDQQLPFKPTDHGKKSDTAAKTTDLGRETPKAAKSHAKEQKQKKKKKKRKADPKQGDELEAADDDEHASSQCDAKSSQKKKANTEKSSKGKRKKAASPGSSTDDFETPPKKAKRPKVANKKRVVSKKVFSLSSGDDKSLLVEASYDVATLKEEEEVPLEGKDLGGGSVSGERLEEVRDDDTVEKSKLERIEGDVTSGDSVQTVESDGSPEQKVEMISYEDFLNSSMEDLEDMEIEKDGSTSGGRTEVGTDRSEDDVLLLESAGEDSVMIIASGKIENYGSNKEEKSTRNSLFGKEGGREEDVDDVTDDIKPLEEDGETSCNKIEDLKNEPGDSIDEDMDQEGKEEDGNVGNAPKEDPVRNTCKEDTDENTSEEHPVANTSKEDLVTNACKDGPDENTSEEHPVANASKEDLVMNASEDDPVVTETPSKPSPSVVNRSPKVVTVEAVVHSPQSGQKCLENASKEASCPAKGRVSNVALDDTDNDISIIEVVKSPVKQLYSIFLKKPKGAKMAEDAEKAKERKEADDESDVFDETPVKKKGKTRESKQDSVKKERPRRTPKRKSTAEKDKIKNEPSVEETTPRSNRKTKAKGKESVDGNKRVQVKKSEKGNKDALDTSGSKEVGGRTLRARRSTAKMKEASSDEDDNEEKKGGEGDRGRVRRMKNKDTTEGKGKTGKPKELLASKNNSKIVQKKNSQSAKAQLLLKKAKGQKVPSSQGQRLQERTRKPTLRLKLDPVNVSLKPIKVIDLDDERKEDMEKNKSRVKNKSIKGSGKVTRKAPAKLAPMFTKEGLKSLAKKQQEETGEVLEVHTLSSDDEHPKANESVASPFTVLAASKKWKEKVEELPVPPFPEISHVQQRENDQTGLDVWNLPRIESSKLNFVKDFPYQWLPSDLTGMDKLQGRITMSHLQGFVMPQIKFETHPELTYENQKAVLEEISKFNPKFPVRRIFKRYLAKRKGEKPEELKKKDEQTGKNKSEQTGRKRKTEHQDDGAERKVRRRSMRARSVKEQPKTPDVDTTVKETTEDKTSECPRPKDLLWCDKYQPTSSEEVLGNTASVKKLAGWLSEWKTKIHRLKKKEAKALKGSSGEPKEDSESDFEPSDDGESDSEDDGDGLCNTILITGPHGVGKTSMVYACAKEMGFKVIEVNASSKRVGRQILDDLGEATQSHQLTGQAGVKSANLAQFFKLKSPSAASSKPKPKPPKPKIHKAFAAFVKAGAKKSDSENMKSPQQKKATPQKAASKRPTKKVSPKKGKATPKKVQSSPKRGATRMKSPANGKKASQVAKIVAPDKGKSGVSGASLILFDEVDIIFDEDKGFLNAVNTFMAGAKRPIILTTSDTHFGDNLEGKFEHIVLRRPDTTRLATNMQLLCLAENVNTNSQDMANLVSYCGNDVRQCLHNLQFWLNSGAMLSSWQHKVKASPSPKVCKLSLKRLKEGEGYSCSVKSENTNVESNKVASLGEAEQTVLPKQHKECFQSMVGSDTFEQLDILFKSENSESASNQDVLPYTLIRKFMRGGAEHLSRLEEDILHKIIEDYPSELHSQNTVKKDDGELGSDNARRKELCAKSLDHFHSYLDNLCDMDLLQQKTNLQSGNTIQDHEGRWWGAEVFAALGDSSDGRMSNWSQEEFNADLRSVLEWVNFQKCHRNLTKVGEEWKTVEQSQTESLDTDTEKISENAEVKGQQPSELLRTDVSSSSDITLLYGVISRKLPRWTRCRPHVVSMDYLPSIRLMCRSEQLREAAHLKRRFLHYFDSISFNLKRTDQVQLASITEKFVKTAVPPVSLEPTENESDSE